MATLDLIVGVLVLVQPPLVLAALVASTFRRHGIWAGRLRSPGARNRLRSARFFECAAYPRLTGWLRFSTQGLAFCGLFLLYDLDLVFFFSEATEHGGWTWVQLGLLALYVLFFLGGLYYDLWRYGLLWSV